MWMREWDLFIIYYIPAEAVELLAVFRASASSFTFFRISQLNSLQMPQIEHDDKCARLLPHYKQQGSHCISRGTSGWQALTNCISSHSSDFFLGTRQLKVSVVVRSYCSGPPFEGFNILSLWAQFDGCVRLFLPFAQRAICNVGAMLLHLEDLGAAQ